MTRTGTGDVTRDKQSCAIRQLERKRESMKHNYQYDTSTHTADLSFVGNDDDHEACRTTGLLQFLGRRAVLPVESPSARIANNRVLRSCLPKPQRGFLEYRRYDL